MSLEASQTLELAVRESDGIHVLLLWHPDDNAVTVTGEDARVGDRFELAVAPDRALDAFYPYAYAAWTIDGREETVMDATLKRAFTPGRVLPSYSVSRPVAPNRCDPPRVLGTDTPL